MLLLPMAVSIVIAVAAYLVFVVVFRAITAEELELVPKGEKIGKLLHIH